MQIKSMLEQFAITKVVAMVDGGGERQDSVAACMKHMTRAALSLSMTLQGRSFVEQSLPKLVKVADEHGAAIVGVRAKDTMKYAEDGIVEETVDRGRLWIIQTPQAFRYDC